jgi:hypothetical protein
MARWLCAGPSGTFADGHPKVNGIVIGFTHAIGEALNGYVWHVKQCH